MAIASFQSQCKEFMGKTTNAGYNTYLQPITLSSTALTKMHLASTCPEAGTGSYRAFSIVWGERPFQKMTRRIQAMRCKYRRNEHLRPRRKIPQCLRKRHPTLLVTHRSLIRYYV